MRSVSTCAASRPRPGGRWSTEHAAAQLLPHLATELGRTLSGHRLRFRIDRGTALREGLAAGRIDIALLLGLHDEAPEAVAVGELDLTWYSVPGWTLPPTDQPVTVVAIDDPCVLRTRALDTLTRHGLRAVVASEAIQLAGVQAAVRAGIGALLSTSAVR